MRLFVQYLYNFNLYLLGIFVLPPSYIMSYFLIMFLAITVQIIYASNPNMGRFYMWKHVNPIIYWILLVNIHLMLRLQDKL